MEVLLSYNSFILNSGKVEMALALFKQRLFIKYISEWNPITVSRAAAVCYDEIYLTAYICFAVGCVLFQCILCFPSSFIKYLYHHKYIMTRRS